MSALLWRWIGPENTNLVYLTAVVGIAVRFGLWPSLVASAASALCYNFFFTAPYYTFAIADPRNVIAVVFFTIVAVVVSNVAARARTLAVTAMARARTTESLYAFSRKLAGAGTLDDVLWASAYQAALMLKVRVVLLLPENGALAVKTGYPPEDLLDEADLAAAKWAWDHDRSAGRGSDTLPGAKRLFLPMRTGRGVVGVVGIDSDKPGPLLTPDQRRLLDALIDQAALAIERVHLVDDLDKAKRREEADRLRAALLTSISHDLKTPLAAIIGAAGTLKDLSRDLDDNAKADLLFTIIDESERLNRFIANLLDMTKLESGAIKPNTALHDLGEIVGTALQRASKILNQHRVEVELNTDLPMLELDAVLFEQVLFNLLDNAAKYAPPKTTICVQSWREDGAVKLQISTREAASRRTMSNGSSTSSIAPKKRIMFAPVPASGSPFRVVSSKPWAARLARRTDRIDRARFSPSPCRYRGQPSGWIPPHERQPRSRSLSSMTSRRSASSCAWDWARRDIRRWMRPTPRPLLTSWRTNQIL